MNLTTFFFTNNIKYVSIKISFQAQLIKYIKAVKNYVEAVNCNICGKSLVLDEISFHINEDFHASKKEELLSQLMNLQFNESETRERSTIDYWRNMWQCSQGHFFPQSTIVLRTSKCTRISRSDFDQENSLKKVVMKIDMNIVPINISKRIHLNI